jgi:hypothetical protein
MQKALGLSPPKEKKVRIVGLWGKEKNGPSMESKCKNASFYGQKLTG